MTLPRGKVALLAEGVDRNVAEAIGNLLRQVVALLAEGVDRNALCYVVAPPEIGVALLAEGVDRNSYDGALRLALVSPSSRRAWIEITLRTVRVTMSQVALLAEGVDRNGLSLLLRQERRQSPSSRRAWIEITGALSQSAARSGRPPRGGRG